MSVAMAIGATMSRVAYVNGRYLPHAQAAVHIEDRGYQFADGVYEVIAVVNGRLLDGGPHLARLERSVAELRMAMPMPVASLRAVIAETVRQNRVERGIVYLQVTRGTARRDHPFPKAAMPSLVVSARRLAPAPALAEAGVAVITVADIRWARCDIKSVALLPNALAKQQAREENAYEAWQVDAAGMVTEGGSTNAWIVTADGTVVTRPAENAILNGITRTRLLALARAQSVAVDERAFSVAEAKAAREAFLTSTTAFVLPVVRIDGAAIGNGHPGSVTLALRELYRRFVDASTAADRPAA
jgi:D-alanine transaminase